MLTFLQKIRDRWATWTGDSELEHAIRRHLSANGLYGGSAKIRDVRLAAVQRPGWLQVYRFDVTAKVIPEPVKADEVEPKSRYIELFGLVREDVRHDITTIRTFDSADARRELFAQWSDNLIQLRGGRALS